MLEYYSLYYERDLAISIQQVVLCWSIIVYARKEI